MEGVGGGEETREIGEESRERFIRDCAAMWHLEIGCLGDTKGHFCGIRYPPLFPHVDQTIIDRGRATGDELLLKSQTNSPAGPEP